MHVVHNGWVAGTILSPVWGGLGGGVLCSYACVGAGVGLAVKWHALGYKMAWLLGLYNMLLFLVICKMARSWVRVCCKK